MKDERKTKKQLIAELDELRQRKADWTAMEQQFPFADGVVYFQ